MPSNTVFAEVFTVYGVPSCMVMVYVATFFWQAVSKTSTTSARIMSAVLFTSFLQITKA